MDSNTFTGISEKEKEKRKRIKRRRRDER